jgi:hypothetical protein
MQSGLLRRSVPPQQLHPAEVVNVKEARPVTNESRGRTRQLVLVAASVFGIVLGACTGVAGAGVAGAQTTGAPARSALDCSVNQPLQGSSDAKAPPLQFGVTAVTPSGEAVALLSRLRGPLKKFGVHAYISAASPPQRVQSKLSQLHALAKSGYDINLNINDENPGGTAPGTDRFVQFVKTIDRNDGSWLGQLEITNEPNFASPTTSDGANPQIITDLVQGVIAAKTVARAHGYRVQIGFNYVYGYHRPSDTTFWHKLKAAATPEFLRDVDWVGLHTYPNTLSLDTPVNGSINSIEQQALATGRCWATWLGLSRSKPIEITEVGYPTRRGASEYAAQANYWSRVLGVVDADRARYNIRSLYVFLLQDAPTTASVFTGFGLFDEEGQPKPAEGTVTRIFDRDGLTKT